MQYALVSTPPLAAVTACIFDVDGVLLASPHERAWREAVSAYANASLFTTAMYQAKVAGKPRREGARAALEALGVATSESEASALADSKQLRFEDLLRADGVLAYPDALRLVEALHAAAYPMAVASSSKNASEMLRRVRLQSGASLLDVFGANVCGRDLSRGKPDPAIFVIAARELGFEPAHCLVLEDASAGIEAARAGGMTALGVARFADAKSLRDAGANMVVSTLDELAIDALRDGRLANRFA